MTTPSGPRSSRIAGYSKLTVEQRLHHAQDFAALTDQDLELLGNTGNLPRDVADHMVENFIGTMNVPVGLAINLRIDGHDRIVPMATEESSVVAAVCNAGRMNYEAGGVTTSLSGTLMIAQIQMVEVPDPYHTRAQIIDRLEDIRRICDDCDPVLLKLGGGFRELDVRVLDTLSGTMVITHIIVDTRDAMGANAVNTMAEKLAPFLQAWTGHRTHCRILSNLAVRRVARAHGIWRAEDIGGPEVRDGIVLACHFAQADPFRAATHNKGIMNGVSAVVLATGNDTRAVEAGAHAYAALRGRYTSLTTWEVTRDGHLAGTLELPMAVGIVGGATRVHPMARLALRIMGIQSAEQLARITAAVGLYQNFAALRVLATSGVQKGHMALHAQNIALMAGAVGPEVDAVAQALVSRGAVRIDAAEEVLRELRGA